MSPRRRLRVLFFAGGPRYYLRQYSSLVAELAGRGHDVRLAFQPSKGELPAPAEHLPGVTYGFAPERAASDGWRSVAWLVRALADLARYAHPRYAAAPELRGADGDEDRRAPGQVRRVRAGGAEVGARARAAAGRRARCGALRARDSPRRAAGGLHSDEPADRPIHPRAGARRRAGHAAWSTGASTQVEFLKSARRLGVPAAPCVASWDNLTNKGLLKFAPERVFVWNEVQRREAVELHGIPPERCGDDRAHSSSTPGSSGGRARRARSSARGSGFDPTRALSSSTLCSTAISWPARRRSSSSSAGSRRCAPSADERLRGLGDRRPPAPERRRSGGTSIWPVRERRRLAARGRAPDRPTRPAPTSSTRSRTARRWWGSTRRR